MRKQARHRNSVLPLGIKNRMQTELPALVALTAIGHTWFSDQHQTDLLAVALVVQEMAPAASLQSLCATELQRLCEDTITNEHKAAVALNLAECLPWLQMQQNFKIDRALQAVAARHFVQAA